MPTVYSASSSQWPLLQSKTEQKFKSGLFNVSAEFIRPVGNTDLPSVIETSIGNVDVWPEPTVSVGTDGFERINATGYGAWQTGVQELIYNFQLITIGVPIRETVVCTSPDGCSYNGNDNYPCGAYMYDRLHNISLDLIVENVYIKQIFDGIPQPPPVLNVYFTTGENVTDLEFTPSMFGFSNDVPGGNPKKLTLRKTLLNSSKQNFGQIIQSEAVWSLFIGLRFDLGMNYNCE